MELVIVRTTIGSREEAERLARTVVEERRAACVHIDGPILSVYRWQGTIETTEEWSCSCKTFRRNAPDLVDRIRALHPYDTPEILVLPVSRSDARYLNWVRGEIP